MALNLTGPELRERVAPLSPYLRGALARAGEHALHLFADEVTREHLISVLLEDEDTALHRLVVHAFADPETIALDVLAISPGILVVAPDATLPFSPGAVEALRAARSAAQEAGRAEVSPAHLLVAALEALEAEPRGALIEAGLDPPRVARAAAAGGAEGDIPSETNLFHHVSQDARRALASAGRGAARAGETSIGPARLVLAALGGDESLEALGGLARRRAALLLEGRTADPTPPPERDLAADAELRAFLEVLPAGAGSLDVLAALYRDPGSELTQAFARQKVGPALLERARTGFQDPEE